jgi:UDP-GlcNAc3NAcA epimerase
VRIISVVGARPQFIKTAVICHAVAASTRRVDHRIVHTGQHYDHGMSDVFFQELEMPAPDYNLGVGSGSHGVQTGEMMKRLEPILEAGKPDWVLVYGDTNSTAAAALVAAKLQLPVAHLEAGLRSYNRSMPEELNRIVADHLGDLLLCPTPLAMENLRKEGLADRALLTGDVMYDAAIMFRQAAEARGGRLAETWLPGQFALATVHRPANTDDPETLCGLLGTLDEIAAEICPVVLPLHPRSQKILSGTNWKPRALCVIPPVSYFEMLLLEGRARFILTDSGGVQKEAYFARVPCITLREETEWRETEQNGCNVLAGSDAKRIRQAVAASTSAGPWTDLYGDGAAGEKTLLALIEPDARRAGT